MGEVAESEQVFDEAQALNASVWERRGNGRTPVSSLTTDFLPDCMPLCVSYLSQHERKTQWDYVLFCPTLYHC